MSRKIILIKQELLLLVYELNRSGLLAENEKIRPILAQLEKLLLCDLACLVRFESSSVPTTLPTAYDVYPLDGRHDGGYYTVKDCVTIDVLPRTPGNNVYVGFMVWSNFTATKCRGLVSLNQVIKEIICLQPLK